MNEDRIALMEHMAKTETNETIASLTSALNRDQHDIQADVDLLVERGLINRQADELSL